jgi:hypothetical protein
VTAPQRTFVQEQVDQLFYVPEGPKGKQKKQNSYPYLGKEIYKGFMDDERNTEKGWAHVRVVIHHDDKDVLEAYSLNTCKPVPVFGGEGNPKPPAEVSNPEPPAEVAWLTLHRDLDLCGEEEDLLQHVAAIHGAFW